MRLVVADTSPLRYLLQIDQVDLLPQLIEKVFIPSVVCEELRHPSAPQVGARRGSSSGKGIVQHNRGDQT